jgi:uncharacterized membrane protein
MPDITLLGWFHTVLGMASIFLGFYSFFSFKLLSWSKTPSRIYLVLTFVTAVSALGIYNQGGFGIAHAMGVLAVLAVLCGIYVEKTRILGNVSTYFYTLCFTSTFLFHSLPAAADILRRLPIGDPLADSLFDPIILYFHIAFLIIYFFTLIYQFIWIKNNNL